MKRFTAVLLVAGVLTGCASNPSESPWLVQRELNPPKRCEPLTGDQELVLGVSQEMAVAGRRHAALANLERLPTSLPQVRLNKARLLRLLGHGDEAQDLYASLLGSCLAADARHGLGQLEASRGNNPSAQEHLRAAASLAPANDAIRNDLGVVYLNQRQLREARFELLTAMELNEGANRAAINLLTLLVYQGDWQTARELVRSKGLSADDFSRAEHRARTMRTDDMRMARGTSQPEIVVPSTASVPGSAAQSAAVVPAPVSAPVSVRTTAPEAVPLRELAPDPAEVAATVPARAAPMPVAVAARTWSREEATPGDMSNQAHDGQQPSADARPTTVCRSSRARGSRSSVMECLPE